MPSGVKREKEVARRLKFDELYLAEQPKYNDIKAPRGPCRQEARGGQREDNGGSKRARGEKKGEGGEYVPVDKKVYYIEYIIRTLGIIHDIISFCMLIATAVLIVYYTLE
jgi:hypothetical protein